MKRKIAITTGARSDYGLIRPIIQEITNRKKLEPYLLVAGMHLGGKNFGSTINEIKKDGLRIFKTVKMTPHDDSNFAMAKALGQGIKKFSDIFKKFKPDINLILGDRTEMLASALAAYHMNIPNAHIHGGDRSQGGLDEYTRHAITKISNIHFAATKKSYQRILKMGENPQYVFHIGSPSIDDVIKSHITNKKILEKKLKLKFTGKEILLVYHPVSTEADQSKNQILNILDAITSFKINTIAIAPNWDAGYKKILDQLKIFSKKHNFIKMYLNFPRSDYLGLLQNCGVLVGNSSSGIIEASYFGIPVVNIGIRQLGRERGPNVVDVINGKTGLIKSAINKSLRKKINRQSSRNKIYGTGNSSKKIVNILEKIQLNQKLIQKQIFY